jgi:hypothetical protein
MPPYYGNGKKPRLAGIQRRTKGKKTIEGEYPCSNLVTFDTSGEFIIPPFFRRGQPQVVSLYYLDGVRHS